MNKMEPNLRKTYYSYSDHKTLRAVRAYFAWQHPGHERAIQDLLVRLREMGVENCSEESWRRFTGRG